MCNSCGGVCWSGWWEEGTQPGQLRMGEGGDQHRLAVDLTGKPIYIWLVVSCCAVQIFPEACEASNDKVHVGVQSPSLYAVDCEDENQQAIREALVKTKLQ